jgi:acetate kinase
MKRENLGVMIQAVKVVITVIRGERALATTMEEDIMGGIVMGKRAGRVQVSVMVDHKRKGTAPRDITG